MDPNVLQIPSSGTTAPAEKPTSSKQHTVDFELLQGKGYDKIFGSKSTVPRSPVIESMLTNNKKAPIPEIQFEDRTENENTIDNVNAGDKSLELIEPNANGQQQLESDSTTDTLHETQNTGIVQTTE